MLNKDNQRELAYVVKIDAIEPIKGSDNCEAAVVGGWRVMVRKNTFKQGDLAVYFEIDSKVPAKPEFEFLAKKHYKIKTQKYTFGGKGNFISQGLLMHFNDFKDDKGKVPTWLTAFNISVNSGTDWKDIRFLTKDLGVTYAVESDNKRKSGSKDKYKIMASRHPKLFKNKIIKWIYKRKLGKRVLFAFFGKKKDIKTHFPTHFYYVKKTDQERCENIPWVLEDKTPYIITEKCDGSSGTYILERKKSFFKQKYEFYVCSRNVRQINEKQNCYYKENHYWNVANEYNIKEKMTDYMNKHLELDYICWQGEVCSPSIQGNPHKLTRDHLFLFHCIDSKNGKWDIRDAIKLWKNYNMETVPIINENYILPDNFESFKLSADGNYDSSICEGNLNCKREGFVYYNTTNPNFSFKNVSREYLLKH